MESRQTFAGLSISFFFDFIAIIASHCKGIESREIYCWTNITKSQKPTVMPVLYFPTKHNRVFPVLQIRTSFTIDVTNNIVTSY